MDLYQFVVLLFIYFGSISGEVIFVVDYLIVVNFVGYDFYGVGMIFSYVKFYVGGFLQFNCYVMVIKDVGVVVIFDGNVGFGQVVVYEVMQLGIEKVKQYGMVVIVLCNVYYVGCIGYWVEQCVVVGLIFIYFVSVIGDLMVVLFCGKDSCFGINLLCVVFFCVGYLLLLLDYVISVIVFGKICVVWYKGEVVVFGCLIDVEG